MLTGRHGDSGGRLPDEVAIDFDIGAFGVAADTEDCVRQIDFSSGRGGRGESGLSLTVNLASVKEVKVVPAGISTSLPLTEQSERRGRPERDEQSGG